MSLLLAPRVMAARP